MATKTRCCGASTQLSSWQFISVQTWLIYQFCVPSRLHIPPSLFCFVIQGLYSTNFFFFFFALSASAYGVGGNPLGRLQDWGEEGKPFSSAFCLVWGFAFACSNRRAVVGGAGLLRSLWPYWHPSNGWRVPIAATASPNSEDSGISLYTCGAPSEFLKIFLVCCWCERGPLGGFLPKGNS